MNYGWDCYCSICIAIANAIVAFRFGQFPSIPVTKSHLLHYPRTDDLLLLSRLHGDTQFPCVCPVSYLLHTLEHPLDEGAVTVEEGRLSHFSLAVEVAKQYRHAALDRVGGSHHHVIELPVTHEHLRKLFQELETAAFLVFCLPDVHISFEGLHSYPLPFRICRPSSSTARTG